MTSSKEIAKYAADLLENIYNNVYGFLIEKDNMEEAVELKDTTDRLCSEILDALDPKRKQEVQAAEAAVQLLKPQSKLLKLKSKLLKLKQENYKNYWLIKQMKVLFP